MNSNDNCFIILGLSPDITEATVIKNAIQAKQAQWSRDINHFDPVIKRTAQENLTKLSVIKQKLMDPRTRKEEAQNAKKIIDKVKKSKEKDFQDTVLLLSKGIITDQAIDNLAVKFKQFYFTKQDIRNYLNKLAVSSVMDQISDDNEQGLEKTIAQTIHKHLGIIKKKTLYDFLEIPSTASLKAIQTKKDEMYRRLKNLPINPTNDVKRDLVGYCSSIFKTADSRKKYDKTLIEETLQPFKELIYRACDSGSIEIGQVLILIKKGLQYKISIKKILRLIRKTVQKRNISVNVADNIFFDKEIHCICGKRNDPLNERCEKCNRSLYFKCSQCNKSLTIDLLECSCGLSLEEGYRLLQTALANNDKEYFYSKWNESLYRKHPAFQTFAKEYDIIKKLKKERELQVAKLKQKIIAIKTAIKKNDYEGIRSEWYISMIEIYPELEIYLPRIKKAFRPADVKNVEAIHYGSYIQVMWQLEDSIQQYIVAWSATVFPKEPVGVRHKKITRGEYERIGFRIENPNKECYYIKVFAVKQFMDEELFSQGTSPGCCKLIDRINKIALKYSLHFKGLFKKNNGIISIETGRETIRIPELVIVAKPGNTIPINVESGIIIHTITSGIISGKKLEQEFSLKNIISPAGFRLFVHYPEESNVIDLIPVSLEKHRI